MNPHKLWFVDAKSGIWSSTGNYSNWHDGVNNEEQIIACLKRTALKFGHTVEEFDYLEIREVIEQ